MTDNLNNVEPTEYERRLTELEADFNSKKKALIREIALKNNPYKTGDIITDHIGSVKITAIGITLINGRPSCFYNGVMLTKSGEPVKRKENKRAVYQTNIKS